ncbi:energy transducer TonB [Silvimonas terrae]|uniref:energy transducer TonB n=1 Tax=Silvimonas terrae TaxID=300266 RepID=UPI00161D0201|nr:energy transducer TonB [Silvimonas terrae]
MRARIILTVKTPFSSSRRTLLLALLCALLAHGCLLLWRGWLARGVPPAAVVSVRLVNTSEAAVTATPAVQAAPAPTHQAPKPPGAHPPALATPRQAPATNPTLSASATTGDAPASAPTEHGDHGAGTLNSAAAASGNPAGNAEPGPDKPARILASPQPALPEAARKRGETGTVILRIRVNEQGGAQVNVAQTSGSVRLDDAARMTVEQSWRFAPAMQAGHRVAGEIIQPVEFRLTD